MFTCYSCRQAHASHEARVTRSNRLLCALCARGLDSVVSAQAVGAIPLACPIEGRLDVLDAELIASALSHRARAAVQSWTLAGLKTVAELERWQEPPATFRQTWLYALSLAARERLRQVEA